MFKFIAYLITTLVALVLVAGGAFAAATKMGLLDSETIDRSGATMLVRIQNLEEFTAAEASFTQDVDLEKNTKFLPGIISGESVVAIVSGTVRATVDLSDLGEKSISVDEAGNAISIRLPKPTLQSADIDEKSVRIIDRDRGVAERVGGAFAENPTDDSKIFGVAEDRLNDAAMQSELMDRAITNTEAWFTTFLGAAGFTKVTVEWAGTPKS